MKGSLSLSIKPDWGEIERIREKSGAFFSSHRFSDDAVYALTMVVSELLENGIKYGDFTLPERELRLNVSVSGAAATIEVLNPVNASAHNRLRRLDRTIQWIRGYQDPFEAYVEKLKEVSKKPLGDDESGLGLARVAYEGRAILDFFVNEEGILNVSAVSTI